MNVSARVQRWVPIIAGLLRRPFSFTPGAVDNHCGALSHFGVSSPYLESHPHFAYLKVMSEHRVSTGSYALFSTEKVALGTWVARSLGWVSTVGSGHDPGIPGASPMSGSCSAQSLLHPFPLPLSSLLVSLTHSLK